MSSNVVSLLASLPPVIERCELKYIVPYSLVEPICRFIEPYCALDHHSATQPGHFYPVNSLYFDTPNFRFLKLRMWGAARRFNMRVRAYADGRQAPYFAEIKYKTPTSVKKFRASLETAEWPGILDQKSSTSQHPVAVDKEEISRELFVRLAHAYAIEPKIFTCYRRKAFFSLIDDYARVTFDINMQYRQQDPHFGRDIYSLSPDGDCINYDNQTIYGDEAWEDGNVVLELKATAGLVPLWMMELIRRFELKQVGFSKYLNSTRVEHLDNGRHYMSADRMAGSFLA